MKRQLPKEVIASELLTNYIGKTFSKTDEALMYMTHMMFKAYDAGYELAKERRLKMIIKLLNEHILDSKGNSKEYKALTKFYEELIRLKK